MLQGERYGRALQGAVQCAKILYKVVFFLLSGVLVKGKKGENVCEKQFIKQCIEAKDIKEACPTVVSIFFLFLGTIHYPVEYLSSILTVVFIYNVYGQ